MNRFKTLFPVGRSRIPRSPANHTQRGGISASHAILAATGHGFRRGAGCRAARARQRGRARAGARARSRSPFCRQVLSSRRLPRWPRSSSKRTRPSRSRSRPFRTRRCPLPFRRSWPRATRPTSSQAGRASTVRRPQASSVTRATRSTSVTSPGPRPCRPGSRASSERTARRTSHLWSRCPSSRFTTRPR